MKLSVFMASKIKNKWCLLLTMLLPLQCFLISPASASQCKLQFTDKKWVASQGKNLSKIGSTTFTPAGKYYSQDRGGTVYIWMGLHIPSSKVKVVSAPSSCANLKQLLGD